MANGVMIANQNLEVVLHNPILMRLLEISKKIDQPVPITEITNDESLISTLKKIQSGESRENESVSHEIKAGKNVFKGHIGTCPWA